MKRIRPKERHKEDYLKLIARVGKDEIARRALEKYWKRPEHHRMLLKKSRKKNPARHLLNIAKTRAKKKGIELSISFSDILIPAKCAYLNEKLSVFGPLNFC